MKSRSNQAVDQVVPSWSVRMRELMENKRLHLGELVELKCKHSQDIEDLKGNHSKDIHGLEQKHLANFAEFQLKNDEELKVKQVEIKRREVEIVNMKYQFKLRCYDSGNGNFEFYSKLVDYLRRSCPASKFDQGKFYSPPADHVYHLALIPVNGTQECHFPSVTVRGPSTLQSIDADSWWLLEIETIFTIKRPYRAESRQRNRLLYYDGGDYTVSKAYAVTYPSFCDDDNALALKIAVCIIIFLALVLGLGSSVSIDFPNMYQFNFSR